MLSYLRDGTIPVGAESDESLVRQIKKEFEYFNMELEIQRDVLFVGGGVDDNDEAINNVERYDPMYERWISVSPMLQKNRFVLCYTNFLTTVLQPQAWLRSLRC